MQKLLSDNGVSRVWLSKDGWVYKRQPSFLTSNAIWILEKLYPYEYVPYAERIKLDLIRLEHIKSTPITDLGIVKEHFSNILTVFNHVGIRHGDLTIKNILIRDNHPYVIDFSESRLASDPRQDKRIEGDEYWLWKTFEGLKIG